MKKITLALAWLLIMSLLMTCAAFAEDIDDAFDPIDEVKPGTEITETFEPTQQLNSAPVPAAATGTVKWTTSNKKVATVSKTGLVTAKAKGTATIKCSITRNKKTKTASLKVSVTPQ